MAHLRVVVYAEITILHLEPCTHGPPHLKFREGEERKERLKKRTGTYAIEPTTCRR
jgi:hypothetical protein